MQNRAHALTHEMREDKSEMKDTLLPEVPGINSRPPYLMWSSENEPMLMACLLYVYLIHVLL